MTHSGAGKCSRWRMRRLACRRPGIATVLGTAKRPQRHQKPHRKANLYLSPRSKIAGSNPATRRRIRRASLETLGMMGRYSRTFGDVRGIGTAEGPQRCGPRDRKDVRLRPQIAQDEFQSFCPAFQVPIRAVLCRWPRASPDRLVQGGSICCLRSCGRDCNRARVPPLPAPPRGPRRGGRR